ncbi:SAP30-Sin3-bdg domain-containing protein [Aphelenchoides bicaudatus]|nr:SAP30-Sin3-bdg domain-containing protein [Aphelenchoides bicaudatus]
MTKKRKSQVDQQTPETPKVPAKKPTENSELSANNFSAFDNDASTSKQTFDPRKSYANFIKAEPRKLKFLRRRNLHDSTQTNDRSGYLSNWYTSVIDNPSFHTLPISYSTAETLAGYSYNGEKEVDRLDRYFGFSKRSEHEIEDQIQSHRQVQEDLIEAERIFGELSHNNSRLASIGWIVMTMWLLQGNLYSKILKALVLARLVRQFLAAFSQNIKMAKLVAAFANPIKAFDLTYCTKVVKKLLPFCWDKKIKVPAVCAFHSSIIDKEPKNTDLNPFFERALGKHERTEPVKFADKFQYEQLAKFIDTSVQKEKDEHVDAMSFDLRLLKLLKPPRNAQLMQEIRSRQLVDNTFVRNGKSVEEFDECYDNAIRRRNELRNTPKCPYKSEVSDEELDTFELPSSTDEWLAKQSNEPGPSAPLFSGLVADKTDLNESERILYKASEFGLLDLNETASSEAAERYRSLLDIHAYDNDTLRVFGSKNNSIEAPPLNFEAISAASIRRIKKFYNLPNRSGATSKPMLIEGLADYFTNKPVDKLQITQDFIALMNERQKNKTDNKVQSHLFDSKTAARKPRQSKKLQISSELKYEAVAAESSTSTTMPLNNLTVLNLISTIEQVKSTTK